MYQNKKILPLVVENITTNRLNSNQTNSFLQSSEFNLLKSTYSLPSGINGPEEFDNYCRSNSIRIPKSTSYNSRTPFDNVALTYQMLISDSGQRNHFCLFNENFLHFNRTHRNGCMHVNQRLSIHTALNYLQYNWNAHAELLESTNFIPLVISPESEAHTNLFNKYLAFNEVEYSNALNAVPDMKIYSEEEVIFVLWKKYQYNFNYGETDDLIYSNYSLNIFNKLKTSILNYSVENSNFNPMTVEYSSRYINITNNRAYWRMSRNVHEHLGHKINLNPSLDITFFKNTPEQSFFTDLVEQHNLKRLEVIKAPSWKTKSSDKNIEFASYTKNQCLKRHASFMGFVNFQTLLYNKETLSTIKTFNLVSSSDPDDLTTSSRALKKLCELLDHLLWKDGIKITDPEQVERLFEEMYSGLNLYSNECCSKLSKEAIESLLQTNVLEPSTFKSSSNKTLTVQPKVNHELKNKYNKINLLYTENLNNISSSDFTYRIRDTGNTYQNLVSYRARIRDAQIQFKEEIDKLCNNIKQIYNSANFIKSNKPLHQAIKTKYLNSFNESLSNSDYTTDDFFNNLAADNIFIESIEYSFKGYDRCLTSRSSDEDFISFASSKLLHPSDTVINHVKFIINRPVKIKIDSKEKYVVGGPYKVICTSSNIRIGLLAKQSLFGVKDNHYCVHPHTTTQSSISNLFDYANGCLGEATSLLYNAFKQCDLKLIILSAMTWVTSANSSDPWGKKYDWFPSLKSLKMESFTPVEEESQDLTEDEVESFLSEICAEEETIEEDQEEEILLQELEDLTITPVEEDLPVPTPSPNLTQPNNRWNPNQFSAPQENYVPFRIDNVIDINS